MRYAALASDYDETLATAGIVDGPTLAALHELKDAGVRFVLVTGRQLADLHNVFPELADVCDWIVGENGPVLYHPATGVQKLLATPPPEDFIERLRAAGVDPLEVGQVVVATRQPNEVAILKEIEGLGLELQIVFNKGGVMVLPTGVNKGTGLEAALAELAIEARGTAAIGDAENDHSLLAGAGFPAAVANALPSVKERAAMVTRGRESAGVRELIRHLLDDDLPSPDGLNPRESGGVALLGAALENQ